MRDRNMTFLELAYETLKKAQVPLSSEGIWEKAKEYGYQEFVKTVGKTPVNTLSARIYVDIRDNPSTKFKQFSQRPALFTLIDMPADEGTITEPVEKRKNYRERDWHPLLSSFVIGDSHFKCYTKTIFHEKSKKLKKGETEWLHPDMVGIFFPFKDFSQETNDLIHAFNENEFRLFSFELKINIDFLNIREYYFQAVSNSSWANEGYLVAAEYQDDPDLKQEMFRLANSFGIGFIRLNIANIEQSEIIVPAKTKNSLDWETINRLSEMNNNFSDFIQTVVKDINAKEVRNPRNYDETFSDENKLAEYIQQKGL